MNNFIYETPTKVYFGKDEELKVGKIIAEFHPKKVLVHFGGNSARKSGLLDKVENCLKEENISFVELGGVVANPELPLVKEGIELGKKEGVDFVLAVGGGSVLDSSKAVSYTHLEKMTKYDPEYWGLALLCTDEQAEIALKMGVRQPKTLDPVSYTHLDVYKRQIPHRRYLLKYFVF